MLLPLRMAVRHYSTASSSSARDLLADCFPSPCVRLSRTPTTTEAPPPFIHSGTPPLPLDALRNRMKDFPRSLVPVRLVRPPTYTPASSFFLLSRFRKELVPRDTANPSERLRTDTDNHSKLLRSRPLSTKFEPFDESRGFNLRFTYVRPPDSFARPSGLVVPDCVTLSGLLPALGCGSILRLSITCHGPRMGHAQPSQAGRFQAPRGAHPTSSMIKSLGVV
jgi:hypothetical protein